MSDDKAHPRLVTGEDLERMGIAPLPDSVTVPTVQPHEYPLDDNDAQQCYPISERDLAPMYIDNPIEATPEPFDDVWELKAGNAVFVLTYQWGGQYRLRLGDIALHGGIDPDELVKYGGIVYPMSGGQLALNPHTTPHLAALRDAVQDLATKASEERLEMAHLVSAFMDPLRRLTGAARTVGNISRGLPFDGNQIVKYRH
jgi:hypothetical protein